MSSIALTYAQIVSLTSLGKSFASSDDVVASTIRAVHVALAAPVVIEGADAPPVPASLTATATDRFMAAVLTLPVGDNVTLEPGDLMVPVTVLTRAVALYKGDRTGVAHYVLEEVTGDGHVGVRIRDEYDGSIVGDLQPHGNFPPVGRLFPTDDVTRDIPGGVHIVAGKWSQLAGFTFPGETVKAGKESAWRIQAAGEPSSTGKPGPVLATRDTRDGFAVRVLIQPNLPRA